jgi:orotidine-5'-phosphate decarboxylase
MDGMVCSAEEVAALRRETGSESILVIPGIRPFGTALNDQRRIATPADAIARGASLLVVGRPITQAIDPAAAARAIVEEIRSGSGVTTN